MINMIEYYKNRAKEYESIYDKPERQNDIIGYPKYLSEIFKGKNVLELACGTGFWTEVISTTAKSIKATDINKTVIEIAKTKNYSKNCKIEIEIMDFRQKSEYGKFDAIFAGFLVSHLTHNEFNNFLNDLILNSENQRIVFMDNNYIEGESSKISKVDFEGNSYQTRKLEDGTTYEILKNFYEIEDLKAMVVIYHKEYRIKSNKYYWSIEINT